jgi:lipopolysaccharide export system protein LptC
MARWTDGYSALIGWLKVLLPLAALAVLSTIFLVARTIDPDRAIPYAEVDVVALAQEPRITRPDYAGMTEDGYAIRLQAETARPDLDDGSRISADRVVAEIETPAGERTELQADQARIDNAAGLMTLTGAVRIRTSTGYDIASDELRARLDRTALDSPGPVRAEGPPGQLTAGTMRISVDADGNHVLVFNGGVDLIYEP